MKVTHLGRKQERDDAKLTHAKHPGNPMDILTFASPLPWEMGQGIRTRQDLAGLFTTCG